MSVQAGKTYRVRHRRKGKFDLRVTAVKGEFVTGEIMAGCARMISFGGYYLLDGDPITIRKSLATFEEV